MNEQHGYGSAGLPPNWAAEELIARSSSQLETPTKTVLPWITGDDVACAAGWLSSFVLQSSAPLRLSIAATTAPSFGTQAGAPCGQVGMIRCFWLPITSVSPEIAGVFREKNMNLPGRE